MEEVAEPFRASGCATGGKALCCMSPCKPTSDAFYQAPVLYAQGHESAFRFPSGLHSPESVMT